MRAIVGLDLPTSGTVTINGHRYRDLPTPLAEVGALLDAKAVHGGRSAEKHLRALALSNGLPVSRVAEVLRIVGLQEVANRRAGSFSLGMSQRLGVAGALLGDPEILMFDEPVNGLDPEGILWIRQFMRELAAQGRTVLVSSHLMSEMALTAGIVLDELTPQKASLEEAFMELTRDSVDFVASTAGDPMTHSAPALLGLSEGAGQ